MEYWVSVEKVKEKSDIRYNVEEKLIENCIVDAQEIEIQDILGTDLFNKIDTGLTSDTLTGYYHTLFYDYIEKALIKIAYKRAMINIIAKMTEKGIVLKDDQGSTPAGIEIFNKKRKEVGSDFAYYANRLKVYLCDNSIHFPEYSTNSGSDVKPSKSDSYFCGLYLG